MKRRSFLSLLGLAPAAPLIAREMAKPAPLAPKPHDLSGTADEHVKLIKKVLRDTFPKPGEPVQLVSIRYDGPICPWHASDSSCYRCPTCREWHCSLGPHAHSPTEWRKR